MSYKVEWRPNAIEDVGNLFEYLARNASLWDAEHVTERILSSTDKLAQFPRMYEAAPQYGEGIRRISTMGQNVLYDVDETTKTVRVFAVLGQRQQSQTIAKK